jgi:hypothetical protein
MEGLFRLSIFFTAMFLPWYNTGLSVAQMLMGAAVLFPVGLGGRLKRLMRNPYALSWAGLYVLILLSLLYSDDRKTGWDLLRTMIPLFSFPLALAMRGGLSITEFRVSALLFLASLAVVSLYDIVFLKNIADSSDHRTISRTVSHLRLGYFLTWGLVLCLEGWYRGWLRSYVAVTWLLLALVMLVMLKSIGMFPFLILAGFLYLEGIYQHRRWLAATIILGGGVFTLILIETSRSVYYFSLKPQPHLLDSVLALPSPFQHWDDGSLLENGTPALVGIHEASLERAWQNRSSFPYYGTDGKGQALRTTLIRYLASKGFWIKDSNALARLSEEDIRAIERGQTNFLMRGRFSLAGRLYEALWEMREYARDGNPQGRSLATRLELWKAGLHTAKNHARRGVGVGDVRQALSDELDQIHSRLIYTKTFGPHNQWLMLALAGGVPLLLWTWISLLLPLREAYARLNHRLNPGNKPFVFFVLLLLGCGFWEDIFETQASMTFFSFFYWTTLMRGHYENSR